MGLNQDLEPSVLSADAAGKHLITGSNARAAQYPPEFLILCVGSQMLFSRPVTHKLAEREGFEPPVGFPLRRFSRPERSTTLPPLRGSSVASSVYLSFAAGLTRER